VLSNEPVVLDQAGDHINEDWHLELPVYNSTPAAPFNFTKSIRSIEADYVQESKDVSQYLWLCLVTMYTLVLSLYVIVKLPPCGGLTPFTLCFLLAIANAQETGSGSLESYVWMFFRSIQYETTS